VESKENAKNPAVAKLQAWDKSAVAEVNEFRGETTVVVPGNRLQAVMEFLAGDPALQFAYLADITTVDRFPIEPRYELNYQLLSIEKALKLRVQVKLTGADPSIQTVTDIWPTANWHERETFDLFGIRFQGHPDLRRILMPEEWEGNPLRKDYPVEGFR
jgi:NADH-quinone oxidoreductase subunit C